MDWTNITLFLTWVVGMGAPAIVAYMLAILVENWAGWSTLPHTIKVVIPLVVSVLLSVGASYALKFPDILAQIQPWFQVTVSAILAYLGSQKGYMKVLQTKYGQRFSRPTSKTLTYG
jgi:hypothetical protein